MVIIPSDVYFLKFNTISEFINKKCIVLETTPKDTHWRETLRLRILSEAIQQFGNIKQPSQNTYRFVERNKKAYAQTYYLPVL